MFKNPGWAKGKARPDTRGPITTAIGPVRTLFEHMDRHEVPYATLPNRAALRRYRNGERGLSVWTLIEMADALGYDIVAVPRAAVSTPHAQQPADHTSSGAGMDPAPAARAA